ncbi:MAG: hypothetical protein AB1410_07340 [Acidobacteriota bacterium]
MEIKINLASNPPRNKKLFLTISTILIFAVSYLMSNNLFNYYKTSKNKKALIQEIENINKQIKNMEKENAEFNASLKKFQSIYGKKIEIINKIIENKAFSWISIFSLLEKYLPPSSYLLSLSPRMGDKKILDTSIVFQDLRTYLNFVENIKKEPKVENISILEEKKSEGRLLISSSIVLK